MLTYLFFALQATVVSRCSRTAANYLIDWALSIAFKKKEKKRLDPSACGCYLLYNMAKVVLYITHDFQIISFKHP